MIDDFAIGLTHLLLALALWRLLERADLDLDSREVGDSASSPLPLAGGAGGGPVSSARRRDGPAPKPSRKRAGDRRRSSATTA